MTIGINAAAAIKQPRTGVEEYAYQLIKHLTMLPEAGEHRFLLYVPSEALAKEGVPSAKRNPNLRMHPNDTNELNPPPASPDASRGGQPSLKGGSKISSPPLGGVRGDFDFPLPPNFEIKILRWPLPFFWTQIRLAWEMLRRSPDVLFIPVHILPFGAPKKSVVTIHGLEYEYFPEQYPFWHRLYLKWSTARAVKKSGKIIAISENTKNDLRKFYGVKAEKTEVVRHGIANFVIPAQAGIQAQNSGHGSRVKPGMTTKEKPYILYIGRIETKKNIEGILEAYEILKKEQGVPHELVLAGGRGYGYKNLKFKIENLKFKVIELGYVNDDKKWQLLIGADMFLFPSFYEGFGLPVLEAQSAGVPVVTSGGSCLPEIAGEGALFVNPANSAQIAETMKLIIDDNDLRDRLRQSGFENVKRFSWAKCARETLKILTD